MWNCVLILSLFGGSSYAFQSSSRPTYRIFVSEDQCLRYQQGRVRQRFPLASSSREGVETERRQLNHNDIEWILRPWSNIDPSMLEQLKSITDPTPFLEFPLPPDGRVVLESWITDNSNTRTKIGRFGITARPGPSHSAITDSIQELMDKDLTPPLNAGAIIYMFVEEDYRKRGIGEMALQVISWIQAQAGCGYTMLVANDNGSGKLVSWYEDHGFAKAPLLQKLLGSPDEVYGTSMIAPTSADSISENFSLKQEAEAPI